MTKQVILALGWMGWVTVLQAGTFIVDTRHPAAADTNAGTREAPLKTISAAAARAVAGDQVVVRPGVYRDRRSGERRSGDTSKRRVAQTAELCF